MSHDYQRLSVFWSFLQTLHTQLSSAPSVLFLVTWCLLVNLSMSLASFYLTIRTPCWMSQLSLILPLVVPSASFEVWSAISSSPACPTLFTLLVCQSIAFAFWTLCPTSFSSVWLLQNATVSYLEKLDPFLLMFSVALQERVHAQTLSQSVFHVALIITLTVLLWSDGLESFFGSFHLTLAWSGQDHLKACVTLDARSFASLGMAEVCVKLDGRLRMLHYYSLRQRGLSSTTKHLNLQRMSIQEVCQESSR